MDSHYKRLLLVLAVNTVVMFAITYVMVWDLAHIYVNINRAYMALLMAAPMGILMLVAMRRMFHSRKLNYALHAAFATLFIVTFVLTRTQTPVGDDQFLRSMIPHHSGAILMCERAALTDPEIVQLCELIVRSQQEEIAQMEAIIKRRENQSETDRD